METHYNGRPEHRLFPRLSKIAEGVGRFLSPQEVDLSLSTHIRSNEAYRALGEPVGDAWESEAGRRVMDGADIEEVLNGYYEGADLDRQCDV